MNDGSQLPESRDVSRAFRADAHAEVVKSDDFEKLPERVAQLRSYWLDTVLRPGWPNPPGPQAGEMGSIFWEVP